METTTEQPLSNLSLDKVEGQDNKLPVSLHQENPVLKFPHFVEEDEETWGGAFIYIFSICLSQATLIFFVAALMYPHATPTSYLHVLWASIPAGMAFWGFRWSNKQEAIITEKYEGRKKIHQQKVDQFNAGLKSCSRVILVKNLQRPGQSSELKKLVEEELFERWVALNNQQAELWPNFEEYKSSIVERY